MSSKTSSSMTLFCRCWQTYWLSSWYIQSSNGSSGRAWMLELHWWRLLQWNCQDINSWTLQTPVLLSTSFNKWWTISMHRRPLLYFGNFHTFPLSIRNLFKWYWARKARRLYRLQTRILLWQCGTHWAKGPMRRGLLLPRGSKCQQSSPLSSWSALSQRKCWATGLSSRESCWKFSISWLCCVPWRLLLSARTCYSRLVCIYSLRLWSSSIICMLLHT